MRRARLTLATIAWLTIAASAAAPQPQGPPPATVRWTAAIEAEVTRRVELTGSVASRSESVVAAAVGGVVAALPAREGEDVERGAALVRLDARELELRLDTARGQLAEAEARRSLAEASLERARQLSADGLISPQQLDDAQSEFEAWEGRRAALAAEVERLRRDLDLTVIRAPFAGVVVRERTAVGEWLAIGDPAAELVDLASLEVSVEVPEKQLAGVAVGATVPVRIESLPELEITGEVRAVVPRADDRARTFPVKVAIPNPDGRIGVGMLARVSLAQGSARSVVVPKDAIVPQGADRFVFLVGDGETARRVTVRVGGAVGAWVAVEGEVAAGDRVVVRGNERLFDGQPVIGEAVEYAAP